MCRTQDNNFVSIEISLRPQFIFENLRLQKSPRTASAERKLCIVVGIKWIITQTFYHTTTKTKILCRENSPSFESCYSKTARRIIYFLTKSKKLIHYVTSEYSLIFSSSFLTVKMQDGRRHF